MLPLFPEPIGYVKEEQAVSIKERSARLVVLERGGEDITVLSWTQGDVKITLIGKRSPLSDLLAVAQSLQPWK